MRKKKNIATRTILLPKANNRKMAFQIINIILIQPAALNKIILQYTREAGVRGLERQISKVCRQVAAFVVKEQRKRRILNLSLKLLTLTIWKNYSRPRRNLMLKPDTRARIPGVATGMAWTASGGDILHIEATKMAGKGNLLLTGKIGEVMSESAKTALSLVRSKAQSIGITEDDKQKFLEDLDVHIHFPAGAVPKDGPSAGITISTALVSLFTGRKVREDTAMTGETSLRGLVLPVGGVKEKVIAAHRLGIKRILLPPKNEKDMKDIPDKIKEEVEFFFPETVEEVFELALE